MTGTPSIRGIDLSLAPFCHRVPLWCPETQITMSPSTRGGDSACQTAPERGQLPALVGEGVLGWGCAG